MPERREEAVARTDRPEPRGPELPTVGEILAMPAVADGLPDVVVGGEALAAPIRWVHVSDKADVARLLVGGELLLSTGAGWPADPRQLTAFITSLVGAGLSGLVLELGTHYRYVPAVVSEAAERLGLAVAALNREVRFVTITEAVHRRIIAEQTTALRARDEIHERFTDLSLRGSPADYVVQQLGRALRSTVVLENLTHEVVAVELDRPGDESVLTDWEARSRAAHRDAESRNQDESTQRPGDWLVVPVEARGVRWGHLVALPGPSHPAGRRRVLQQGAIALALGRLADPTADEWARLGHQRLVESLLEGRYANLPDATARLEAAGVPIHGRTLLALSVPGLSPAAQEEVTAALHRVDARGIAGFRGGVLVVLCSTSSSSVLADEEIRGLARDLAVAADVDPLGVVVHVSAPAADLGGLLDAAHETLIAAAVPPVTRERGPVVRRIADRPLLRLVASLRDDHRLQRHSESVLAPLIEHDLARGGDLLAVLTATVAHPGNRTAAAVASHLSRSVYYHRLSLIADLLGVDLDDGETLTALHLALLARSVGADPGRAR